MNDILNCCRLPDCDQLLILDCCFAANAFGTNQIGRRKFEMMVSCGLDNKVPAPTQESSFTIYLLEALSKLLKEQETGFMTSQLYREIYHSIPSNKVKPWLFDQAQRDYGRIWLCPQAPDVSQKPESEKGGAFLNLTLKLNKQPDSIAMNQLATNLQYLPHIDEIRFEKLYAPREQIEDFMQFVRRAAKLRPLVRKVHAKRRLKKLQAPPEDEKDRQRPLNLMKLWLDQKPSPACDWSSALQDSNPSPSSPIIRARKKSFTWPPVEEASSKKAKSFSNRFFSMDYQLALPTTSSLPQLFPPRRANTTATDWQTSAGPRRNFDFIDHRKASWETCMRGDDVWHVLMWFALSYAIACFWMHLKE